MKNDRENSLNEIMVRDNERKKKSGLLKSIVRRAPSMPSMLTLTKAKNLCESMQNVNEYRKNTM